jgi:hypothetical protein
MYNQIIKQWHILKTLKFIALKISFTVTNLG